MPQDYYVKFVIALSTNTLYEGLFIFLFFINKVYHFFDNDNTMEQKTRELGTLFCYLLKFPFQQIMSIVVLSISLHLFID